LGLKAFFEPRSIAVFGASTEKTLFANLTLRNLRNHQCSVPVHVIHPGAREIDGIPCLTSMRELSEPPDLCIIGVRADRVADIIRECVDLGVPAASIVAAGFAEVGTAEGAALQETVNALRTGSSLRIIGPNTLGVASFATHAVSISSGNIPAHVPSGPVAIVAQSGGVALSIMLRGIVKGLGFSHLVAVGNESDVSLAETVEFLGKRADVGIVLCYVEGVRDMDRLRRAIEICAALGKPVVLLKGGQTRAGQRATASHTGALAGSGPVWRSVMTQLGAINAESIDHMLALGAIFSRHGKTNATRLGAFCVGGGLTVLFTDMLDKAGIITPALSPATVETIKTALPDITPNNPCDMGGLYLSGDGSVLNTALRAMADDPDIDALAIGYCPVITEREQVIGGAIARSVAGLSKPVTILSYEARPDSEAHRWFRDAGLTVIDEPDAGVLALKSWLEFKPELTDVSNAAGTAPRDTKRRAQTRAWAASRVEQNQMVVLEDDAKRVLRQYGLSAPPEQVVDNVTDAVQAAAAIGYPLVLKVLSTGMTHRGVGRGVVLNLGDEAQLRAAFQNMQEHVTELQDARYLVQRMAGRGNEFLIGAFRDSDVGLVIAISEGGGQAESSQHAMFCILPCNRDVLARRLANWPVVTRSRDPVALEALLDAVMAVAAFLEDADDFVSELDVNPVIVPATGAPAVAVDGLLFLRNPTLRQAGRNGQP